MRLISGANIGGGTAGGGGFLQSIEEDRQRKEFEKKQQEKQATIDKSIAEAERYQQEAEKAQGKVDFWKGIGKSVVRPFISAAEVPKLLYTGGKEGFGKVNVPGLGETQSYQEDFRERQNEIIEGRKPLYSALAPMGEAVLDTASLGLSAGVAKAGIGTIKGGFKQGLKQTAKRFAPLAGEGAVYGAGYGGLQSIEGQYGAGDTAKAVFTGASLGAGLTLGAGVGFSLIGKGLSKLKLGDKRSPVDPEEAIDTFRKVEETKGAPVTPEEEQGILDVMSRGAKKDDIVEAVGIEKKKTELEAPKSIGPTEDAVTARVGRELNLEEKVKVIKDTKAGKQVDEIARDIVEPKVEPTPTRTTSPVAKSKAVEARDYINKEIEVFHGTDSDFDSFTLKGAYENSRDISGSKGAGIFFTTKEGVASGYPKSKSGKVVRASVKLSEPFVIDAKGGKFSEISIDTIVDANGTKGKLSDIVEDVLDEASPDGFVNVNQIAKAIKDKGSGEYFDGLIVKNVKDPGMRTKNIDEVADTIIVFDEKAIKKSTVKSKAVEEVKAPEVKKSSKEDALIAEARKYKTEEKFLKAHSKIENVSIKKLEIPEFNNGKEVDGWDDIYAQSNAKTRDKMDKDINFLLADKNNELEPILVNKDGTYLFVEDGHHRTASYRYAGRESIPMRTVQNESKLSAIYKEAHEAPKKEITPEPEMTAKEAKASGKSFDEWVKGQRDTLYHGTSANTDKLSTSFSKQSKYGNQLGDGIYFTRDNKIAKSYGKNIFELDKNKVKIFDGEKDLSDVEIKTIVDLLPDNINKDELALSIRAGSSGRAGKNLYYKTEFYGGSKKDVNNALKKLGYDGVSANSPDKKIGNVINIFNDNALTKSKTRSQLKAEWDKIPDKKPLLKPKAEWGGAVAKQEPKPTPKPEMTAKEAKASGQSFDEWVKGQGEIFRAGELKDVRGTGLFFSDNINVAKQYETTGLGGKATVGYVIPKDLKLKEGVNRWRLIKELDNTWDRNKVEDRLIRQGVVGGLTPNQRLQALVEKKIRQNLTKQGFDGVKYSGGITDQAGEYQIFNTNSLKTRSQLKAEWDAVKPTPEPATKPAPATTPEPTPKPVAKVEEPLKGKTSGYAETLKIKALEQKLGAMEELAEYTPRQRAEQAERSVKLLNNREDALKVLRGEKAVPRGLAGESLAKAVEEQAIKTNDFELFMELSRSKIASGISDIGSRLSMLVGRNADTPLKAMEGIKKARKEAFEKISGDISAKRNSAKREIVEEVKSKEPKKSEWVSFLEELKCK